MCHMLSFFIVVVVVVVVFMLNGYVQITSASSYPTYDLGSFRICANGETIKYPLYSEPSYSEYYAGYPGLYAKCSVKVPIISLSNHSYYYRPTGKSHGRTNVQLMDIDIDGQTCPQPIHNFSLEGVIASSLHMYGDAKNITYFYNCTTLPNDVKPNLPCIDNNNNYSGSSFAMLSSSIPVGFNWYGNCQQKVTLPATSPIDSYAMNYTKTILAGIDLWLEPTEDCQNCEKSGGRCSYFMKSSSFWCNCNGERFDIRCPSNGKLRKLVIGLFVGVGGSLLILLLIYIKRCSKATPINEEVFLQSYKPHVLHRYKYSDIKKMTNSFKEKLGQGGFGFVFKGKLPDDRMVAVKLLNESKGDGEEFINEVVTIGRTNHVNVVTLIGFCIEGSKRALVYDFMVNGSLEKFIYKKKLSTTAYAPALRWDELYQIALGIARGLEYLHRGCNNRILHFDIKPHNILLDSKFIPKISDFGLAKLSQTRDSIVSIIGTRGTSGYIAPEIYCRNVGVVSYKSDVYSYGMMLFEMIGGRKNIDATVDNISEIYFPHWIYDHLNKKKKMEGSRDVQIEVSNDILEDAIARKMIIVALWCIQAHPNNRPSMNKVVEILEGTNEKLQMPPNPFLDSSFELLPPSSLKN